jgi:hypothetical protein
MNPESYISASISTDVRGDTRYNWRIGSIEIASC